MPVKQAVEQTHCVRHQLLSLTILWTPRAPCWATTAPGGRARCQGWLAPKEQWQGFVLKPSRDLHGTQRRLKHGLLHRIKSPSLLVPSFSCLPKPWTSYAGQHACFLPPQNKKISWYQVNPGLFPLLPAPERESRSPPLSASSTFLVSLTADGYSAIKGCRVSPLWCGLMNHSDQW